MEIFQVKVIVLVLTYQVVSVSHGFESGPGSGGVGERSATHFGVSGEGYQLKYNVYRRRYEVVPINADSYREILSNIQALGAKNNVNRFKRDVQQPGNFSYRITDRDGNVHYRSEERFPNGNVRGKYGYENTRGLFREVGYYAGERGYRSYVWTNEPGMDNRESPADTFTYVFASPPGIYGNGTTFKTSNPPPCLFNPPHFKENGGLVAICPSSGSPKMITSMMYSKHSARQPSKENPKKPPSEENQIPRSIRLNKI